MIDINLLGYEFFASVRTMESVGDGKIVYNANDSYPWTIHLGNFSWKLAYIDAQSMREAFTELGKLNAVERAKIKNPDQAV